jgi:hypothetical protein
VTFAKVIVDLIILKDAERRWAAKLIRKETSEKLPNLD